MFRANNFDKLLDKATSNLRLEPDWPTILQICDLIRQNDCTPKYAVAALKKKLYSQNPHQAMFALLTLESIVKNCGSGIHDEVASKAFCEMLRDLVKTTQHENLRNKILELIQAWGFAFRNNSKYRAVQDTVNILKAECYKFPPLKESDAMFSADSAPEWADGEVCHRCRVAFSLMVRRHHCRACGQVFCQQCSSKNSTLPKFGIEKEVRVCDACYDKVSRPPTSTAKLEIIDTANDYGPTQPQKRPGKSAEELQEEEELQLALALSQSEAEHKEKERRSRSHIAPDPTPHPTVSPTPSSVSASPEHGAPANAELSRYLDRSYWEQRLTRDTNAPTAPAGTAPSETSDDYVKPTTSKTQEDDKEDKEIDEFVETLKSQVEIFVNRMKSNSSRGRSIANDTSVQSLFMNITAMHSQLLRYIQQQDDKRVYLESLQDKINQIRDSRAALDTLRAEHTARLAAAAEAAERQRQMQMAAKLQAMRKKKHEYLQYQRQLALQRVQEQEREMQMRQEQQKHQYMMSAGSGYYMPGVSMPQYPPTFPNQQPIYATPQFHPQMMPQATTEGPVSLPGQPQMSQANIPMSVNQMGALAQSMPQLTNSYAMTTSGMAISQAPISTQPSMNPQNIRSTLSQHMPMQQQMMMHQMRMSQPGVHQMMQQGVNSMPGQNMPQLNGQGQLPKQNLPNQPQPPTSMMGAMSIGQPNIGQPQMTQANAMLGMQMQNMRMPIMQGQNPQAVSSYQLNQQNNQQPHQQPNMQQQSQMPGQPMSLPGQQIMPQAQNQSMPQGQIPNNSQNIPQMQQPHNQQMPQLAQQHNLPQGQPMAMPGQPMQPPGQPINMQGPQMLPQGQNIPQPGQHMMNQPMQMGQLGQQSQIMHGQIPQQMQMGQVPQQMPPQGQQQMPQGQQMQLPGQQMPQNQGQPMKMPSQNYSNGPSPAQPPPNQQPPAQPQTQPQQPQTPVKSEHNNNTAELISFD
ncbi:hepatocyte growth factor regulated tyrosine kinase substrate isoform X2 [Choristoneura fumiferana]|uniref:hepatocyte growth factor regulated tyrosine kinase substrate isoform X2 n=1 Tax=Choristoneura fumiferana TaxID=7141 RepID=UPI003D15CF7E